MKKIALFLFYTLLFFGALFYFTPKEELYYFGEEQLKPLGVVIGSEDVVDHGFSLELLHAKLYVQKIKSADIASTTIGLFGFYNTVSVNNITLDKTFEQFFPTGIGHINIGYSILSPLQVNAEAVGDFGEASATFNLRERKVNLTLTPSKLMLSRYRNTLRQFKKSKEGGYTYGYQL